MGSRAILPLIDLVFLTLGSVLGVMTQMERVTILPVEVAEVGSGSAVVVNGDLEVVTLSHEGLTLNGNPIARDQLESELAGKSAILKSHKNVSTGQTLLILSELNQVCSSVSVSVEEVEDSSSR